MPVRKSKKPAPTAAVPVDLYEIERRLHSEGISRVAGIDEAGRGPLAGPVCAAAVIFRPGTRIDGVNDSKQLEPEVREVLYEEIMTHASAVGVGWASAHEIDNINILRATHLAARRALRALTILPEYLLLDALQLDGHVLPQMPLVKGDARSFSIAAASIVAKVTRDRLMCRYAQEYPEYGFESHKGYGTPAHRAAIDCNGPSAIHRVTFLKEWFGTNLPRFSATHVRLQKDLQDCRSHHEIESFVVSLRSHEDFLPQCELVSLRGLATDFLSHLGQP